jgi:hypothetical protein
MNSVEQVKEHTLFIYGFFKITQQATLYSAGQVDD